MGLRALRAPPPARQPPSRRVRVRARRMQPSAPLCARLRRPLGPLGPFPILVGVCDEVVRVLVFEAEAVVGLLGAVLLGLGLGDVDVLWWGGKQGAGEKGGGSREQGSRGDLKGAGMPQRGPRGTRGASRRGRSDAY